MQPSYNIIDTFPTFSIAEPLENRRIKIPEIRNQTRILACTECNFQDTKDLIS